MDTGQTPFAAAFVMAKNIGSLLFTFWRKLTLKTFYLPQLSTSDVFIYRSQTQLLGSGREVTNGKEQHPDKQSLQTYLGDSHPRGSVLTGRSFIPTWRPTVHHITTTTIIRPDTSQRQPPGASTAFQNRKRCNNILSYYGCIKKKKKLREAKSLRT
jgi:hypothetical protein